METLEFVQLVRGAAQVRQAFEDLIRDAAEELLMFTRPPYSWDPSEVNPVVMEVLARGISTRVLYRAADWDDPTFDYDRSSLRTYHDAGVVGRVVQHLPMKLAVVDRKRTLFGLEMPDRLATGFPSSLRVEDPGFAQIQAHAFEHLWATARPVA